MNSLRKCGDIILEVLNITFGPIDIVSPFFNSQTRRLQCKLSEFPIALIIMSLYVIWCAVILSVPQIYETTPDVSQTFNVVGATLAFILPLIAANAVTRNKEALNNYNAFCGDVLALGWEVLAYVRDEVKNTTNDGDKGKIQGLFEICLALPTMVKWKFRGGLDIEKVYMVKYAERNTNVVEQSEKISKKTKRRFSAIINFDSGSNAYPILGPGKFRRRFVATNIGNKFKRLYVKVAHETKSDNGEIVVVEKGIDECDLLFAMVNKLISEFKTKGDTRKNMLQRTLERVYGSYGNMGNINAYNLPQVYNVYMYISMFIFVMLFPLNYETKGGKLKAVNITTDGDFEALYTDEYSSVVEHQWNIVWHGLILIYFLFGFHFMTTKVGNAFKAKKDSPGYITVGETETTTNRALIALYTAKDDFQRDGLKVELMTKETDDNMGVESKGETVTLLTNRRKLYV